MLIAVLGVALTFAAPAFAGGGSVFSGHTSQPAATNVLKTKPSKGSVAGTVSPTVKSSGTLPFTGLNLAFAAAAGVVLVGAGAMLRRSGRNER